MNCIDCEYWEDEEFKYFLIDGTEAHFMDDPVEITENIYIDRDDIGIEDCHQSKRYLIGKCNKIKHWKLDNNLAYTKDGSDYFSGLYTAEKFGCIHFKNKEKS